MKIFKPKIIKNDLVKNDPIKSSFSLVLWFVSLIVLVPLQSVDASGIPRRVVSLAPSLTEMMFELDLGSLVVGVTEQCNFPAAAQTIAKIGPFFKPKIEQVLLQKPDLVLVGEGADPNFLANLQTRGIQVFKSEPKLLSDVERDLISLANVFGLKGRSERYSKKWKEKEQALKAISSKRNPPKGLVLILIELNPTIAAASGTWLSDLFELSGYQNVLKDRSVAYPMLKSEFLATLLVDKIFLEDRFSEAQFRAWADAQKNSRLKAATFPFYRFPSDVFLRPGPRVLNALEILNEK
jgi:iron complex transport system substrate-binding protein